MELSQPFLCSYWHERQHQQIQTRKGQVLKNLRSFASSYSGEKALEDKLRFQLQTDSSWSGDRQTVRPLITQDSVSDMGAPLAPNCCPHSPRQTLSIEGITEASVSPYFEKDTTRSLSTYLFLIIWECPGWKTGFDMQDSSFINLLNWSNFL